MLLAGLQLVMPILTTSAARAAADHGRAHGCGDRTTIELASARPWW
jgi:hypothetical protein